MTWTDIRKQRLYQRQQIISTIRDDLYNEGFLEAETPILVKNTTPDAFIDSIQADGGYLITSTEYQVKRLIADGFDNVFTLTKNFRAHDRGRYHSPEFTMLEWGRAFKTLSDIEEDAIRLIKKAFHSIHHKKKLLNFNGNEIDLLNTPWDHLTVREAFYIYLGIEDLGDFSLECLCRASKKADIFLPDNFQQDKSLAVSFLLDQLQSHLGKQRPIFLHEWPSYLTSSTPTSLNLEATVQGDKVMQDFELESLPMGVDHSQKVKANPIGSDYSSKDCVNLSSSTAVSRLNDSYVAERSELYIGGIEIANGFPFLTNSETQKILFDKQQNERKDLGKPIMPIDEKYVEALKKLPQGAGMALGIDRLVVILTEANKLSDVQSFDWDEL